MRKLILSNVLFLLLPVFGCVFIQADSLIDSALIPRFLFCTFCFVVGASWTLIQLRKDDSYKFSSLNPVSVLFFLWLISTLISGVNALNKTEYLIEVQKVFMYFSLYLLFLFFLSRENSLHKELFLKVILSLVSFLLLIGIYQFFEYKCNLTSQGMTKVSGMMNNRNLFAEYLGLCLPFVLSGCMIFRGKWKFVSFVLSFLIFIAILLLFTRSVYVATFISILFSGILILIIRFKQRIKFAFSNKSKLVLLISVLLVGLISVKLNYHSGGAIKNRLMSVFAFDKGSAGGRIKVWKVSGKMIDDSGFFGVGAGNWKINFESYGFNQDGKTFTTEPLNDYLGIYCESGLTGLIGYAGMLFGGIFLLSLKLLRGKKEFDFFSLAVLSSLVSFAVISFFNFPKDRIEPSVLMCFLIAFASIENSRLNIFSSKKVVGSMFIVLILISTYNFITWFQRFQAEQHLAKALQARENQQWGIVVREINKGLSDYYSLDPTTTPMSWYSGIAHYSLGELEAAYSDFEKAYTENPYHLHVINNFATAMAMKNDNENALKLFEDALVINPLFYDAIYNEVAVLYKLKRYDDALKLLDTWKRRREPKVREYIRLLKEKQKAEQTIRLQ